MQSLTKFLLVGLVAGVSGFLSTPATAAPLTAETLQADGCGKLENAYGPFNWNTADGRRHWKLVRRGHFRLGVQNLRKGITGSIPHELDYTLRAIPNQPWALYDMALYQLQHGYPKGQTHQTVHYYTAVCYFKRAMLFAPKDGVVRLIYGVYLQRKGKLQLALERYKQAQKLLPPARSAELHYDMGLLYVKMKEYGKAREQARLAYHRGYPLEGLRKELERLHEWRVTSSSKRNR